MSIQIYSEDELAQLLHTQKRNVADYRLHGLISGIKTGKQWVYGEEEVRDFFRKYANKDISNKDKILSLKKR